MPTSYIFSSESVGEGHPDKVADTISDGILDACLAQDKYSRVACETFVKSNMVVVGGEITTKAKFDYNDIIRAAAETFYQKGYGATTTQDIADAVGMLKGSLYYYITAKEDLLYEIIDEVHEVLAKNLEVVAAMDGDPLARIWTLVHHNVIVNAQNLINSAVFFRDFSALTGRRRKHILALRDKGDTMLRELIAEGQAKRSIRADVDPKLAATAINTMCNALYHWYKPDGALTPEEVARSYADMAVGGLTADAKRLAAVRAHARPNP